MIEFSPPEFADQLAAVYRSLREATGLEIGEFSDEAIDHTEDGFDAADYEDQTITPDSIIRFSLPRSEVHTDLSYSQLIDIIGEASAADYEHGEHCWLEGKVYTPVSLFGEDWNRVIQPGKPKAYDHEYLEAFADFGGIEIRCTIVTGLTTFGVVVVREDEYDKYYPPLLEEDCFIKTEWSDDLERPAILRAIESYMFELNASLNLELVHSPRAPVDEMLSLFFGEEVEHDPFPRTTLRPLLVSESMSAPIRLYNEAVATHDPRFRILNFVKVLEHVSQTVVQQKLIEDVIRKLSTSQALKPTADFIAELKVVFDENRSNTRDQQALILTVGECCDAHSLSENAPEFLKSLRAISSSSDSKARQAALSDLALALSATRNWIAHAKANYTPTGWECPEEQLGDFAHCARVAAHQAIRWYGNRPESMRLT